MAAKKPASSANSSPSAAGQGGRNITSSMLKSSAPAGSGSSVGARAKRSEALRQATAASGAYSSPLMPHRLGAGSKVRGGGGGGAHMGERVHF
jgi:hypothetical protein